MSPRERMARVAVLLCFALLGAGPALGAPQVQVRLSSGAIETGGALSMFVTVSDPKGGVGDPQFDLPSGLSLLASSRGQNFSFVNGRASSQVEYRYELGSDHPGQFAIGPIRVRVGDQVFVSSPIPLTVTSSAARPALPSGSGPASLHVEVTPTHPYVGELVQLTVRLVQRVALAEDSQYQIPPTPGFWAEGYGDARQYQAHEGARSVAVTERRARLYPLAAGDITIGSAAAVVVPMSAGGADPFFAGGGASRPVEVRSDSLRIAVRALPGGAPASFDGAVGDLHVVWNLDRSHTTQDQPLTLAIDVRGIGNLPLMHSPKLDLADFEVFASTSEDSLAPLGERLPGRRRFQWTLLPRRTGTLQVQPPAISWFDPQAGVYRTAPLAPLSVEVLGAGLASANAHDDGFPAELSAHACDPGRRPAQAWGFALAGLAVGLGVRLWRRGARPDPLGAERARQREWLRAVGLARGLDFWQSADQAVAWVESRGGQVLRLREDIAAARYGGRTDLEDDVRRRLVERVAEALPQSTASGPPWRIVSVGLWLLAALGWFLGSPQHGDERLAVRARAADAAAAASKLDGARSDWLELWREAPGDPALAARLGWCALQQNHLGEAAAWVLRGQAGEARDGAVAWTAERVREAGGLTGAHALGSPLRSLEWAALAFALALGACLEWPRRWSALGLGVLALLATIAPSAFHAWRARAPLAVIVHTSPLAGADLDLESGQVVRLVRRTADGWEVSAGRDLRGTVAADALLIVDAPIR